MNIELEQKYEKEIEELQARARAELIDLRIHEEKCRLGDSVGQSTMVDRTGTKINEYLNKYLPDGTLRIDHTDQTNLGRHSLPELQNIRIRNVLLSERPSLSIQDPIDDPTSLEEASKALQKETHSTGAQKEIVGKLRYDLVPVEFEDELAKVYTEGAKKYSDRNWEKGLLFMKHHYAAARRHMAKWVKGVDLDDETNTHHLANAAWHLAAIITLSARGRTDLDDRNK
jgi:hypothetical protein